MINNKNEGGIIMRKGEKRNVVIMDGTNKKVVKDIVSIIEMLTGRMRWFNKIRPKKIDRQHPNMLAIKFRMTESDFGYLQRLLDKEHPAQCAYDVIL